MNFTQGSNQQQFPPQAKLGPFRLHSELSNDGNMAWVYRAVLREDKRRQVVLKIARADGQYEQIFEQLLRHEAKLLKDFRHPGIVHLCPIKAFRRVLDVGRAEDLAPYCNGVPPWYFAMELLPGGTLERNRDYLQRFPLEWKLELIYQIAIILDYLHLRETAHMDLKPSNIVFRSPPSAEQVPTPVLIDFGIAEKQALRQEVRAATLMYAAPERVVEITGMQAPYRVTDTNLVNNMPSDVWALGIMAYEILTGRYPFRLGKQKEELARSILMDDIPPMAQRGMPSEVEEMVRFMLEKRRDRRPLIAQVLMMIDTYTPITPPRITSI